MRAKKPAQAEQKRPESKHRWPRASPLYIFLFLFVFGRINQIYFFHFFGRSGPVLELVPSYCSPRPCNESHHITLDNDIHTKSDATVTDEHTTSPSQQTGIRESDSDDETQMVNAGASDEPHFTVLLMCAQLSVQFFT